MAILNLMSNSRFALEGYGHRTADGVEINMLKRPFQQLISTKPLC